jgi:hypothetical protein
MMSSSSNNTQTSELQRIQRECASMAGALLELNEEERQLREANAFLARRAMVMGCTAGLDGGTRRGARRKAAAKKIAASSSSSSAPSSSSSSSSPPAPHEGDFLSE